MSAAIVRSQRIHPCLSLTLVLMLLAGCAGEPAIKADERAKLDELLGLMKAQLDSAAQAARDAWDTRRSLDDPRAEAEFIDSAVNRALEFALPPEFVHEFFRAQVEAGKHAQSQLHAQWQADPKTRPASSSNRAQSARALPSSAPLLAALGPVFPLLRQDGSRAVIEQRANEILAGVPGGARAATLAIAPLWRAAR